VGVKVRHFPLTRLIAYTTACCYRTSRDVLLNKNALNILVVVNSG